MRDFSVLSDIEFEEVVADLLSAELGVLVERFARGSDGGVDLRWRVDGVARRCIGQCKHYQGSALAQLLSAARAELPHVEKLRPGRYVFITSRDLTVGQKDKVHKLFSKWMAGPDDVLGGRDVDGLLTRHENVERRHPKLWLATGSQLFWATHSDIANRTSALRDRVTASLPRYVVNRGYKDARTLLDTHRVCLIAGVPGIGKTMLAQVLVADAMALGYEPVDVSGDIDEAWTALRSSDRQVFLYDDFLGQLSFAERLGKNEDGRLADFVAKVAKTRTKLLILTTREYILQDARRSYGRLNALDERMHFILALEDYARADRARILYNHLWHATLSDDARRELAGGGYRAIVDHQNYSPRLIEFCTGPAFDTTSPGYVQRFVDTLDHPARLWRNAFENHLRVDQQMLAVVLASLPSPADLLAVQEAHRALCQRRSIPVTAAIFRTALEVMEGTFVSIERLGGQPTVRFHNPSIREFTLDWLGEDPDLVSSVVESAVYYEQLQQIHAYAGSLRGQRVARSEPMPLQSALALSSTAFVESLRRTVMRPAPTRTTEWDSDHGQVVRQASSWFEARVDFALRLPEPFRPTSDWLADRIADLADRWSRGEGSKSEAVKLMRQVHTVSDLRPYTNARRAAEASLDRWLARNLRETEQDWVPYLTWLEQDTGIQLSNDSELVERFAAFVDDELGRWSPTPPNLDDLQSYAEKFELHDLVAAIEEKAQEAEREDRETGSRTEQSPGSAPGRRRSDNDSDEALDKLFARLRDPQIAPRK